jgi:hypothetical protein
MRLSILPQIQSPKLAIPGAHGRRPSIWNRRSHRGPASYQPLIPNYTYSRIVNRYERATRDVPIGGNPTESVDRLSVGFIPADTFLNGHL